MGALLALPHAQRLDRLATQRQGQHRTTLGDVDVVVGPLARRPLVVALPGGWLQVLGDDGVVLEDEEEGPLAERGVVDGRGVRVGRWEPGRVAADGWGALEGAVHEGVGAAAVG